MAEDSEGIAEKEYSEFVKNFAQSSDHLLRAYWGEKCPDFEENCTLCQVWQSRDNFLSLLESGL